MLTHASRPMPGAERIVLLLLTATVTLTLRSKKDALTVPSAAVRVDDGDHSRRYVTVVDGEKERRVKVRVGLSHGGRTEILSGLEQGEMVAVSGTFLLKSAERQSELGGGHSH